MGEKKFLKWLGLCLFLFTLCLMNVSVVSAEERTEIRVGAINSLTGMNVMTGAEHKWGYEQAVADINEKGGVFVKELNRKLPIKLIFADDKSTPDQGAAAMERLIKVDKIDLALSSNITPINIAAGTVAEKYKVYFQIVISWLDFIEKENFKWVSDMFTSTTEAARTPFLIWEEQLPKDQRPKRPALMMEDNQDGQGFGMGFKAFLFPHLEVEGDKGRRYTLVRFSHGQHHLVAPDERAGSESAVHTRMERVLAQRV